jgi:hypothetical protein
MASYAVANNGTDRRHAQGVREVDWQEGQPQVLQLNARVDPLGTERVSRLVMDIEEEEEEEDTMRWMFDVA